MSLLGKYSKTKEVILGTTFQEKLWSVPQTVCMSEPVSPAFRDTEAFGHDAGSVPSWVAVKTYSYFQKGKDAEPGETGEFI